MPSILSAVSQYKYNILISCAGLGMGNASRVAALIEAIRAQMPSVGIHVYAWGQGYLFLSQFRRVSALDFELIEIMAYSGAGCHPLALLVRYIKNSLQLARAVLEIRPQVILLDSDYHFLAYLGQRQKVLFVGQALDVVERAQKEKYHPTCFKQWFNLLVRERLDAFLQRVFASEVLVPSFAVTRKTLVTTFRWIPLIVRQDFLQTKTAIDAKEKWGVLLSGSRFEREQFRHLDSFVDINQLPSKAETLDRSPVVFVQGGLSSISECLARDRFMVVFPLANHVEQILNAQMIESMNLGIVASTEELKDLPRLVQRTRAAFEKRKHANIDCRGAQVVADVIQARLNSSSPTDESSSLHSAADRDYDQPL